MSTTHAWFVPYRLPVPADLELWLEGQARHGRVLDRVRQCSSIRMALPEGEPATYRYVVDLQARIRPDYLTMYADFGWEYLGQMSTIHLWRRAYDEARPEAFTDADSLRARSLRFEIPIAAMAALSVVGAVVQAVVALVADLPDGGPADHLLSAAALAVTAALLGVVAWRIGRARER